MCVGTFLILIYREMTDNSFLIFMSHRFFNSHPESKMGNGLISQRLLIPLGVGDNTSSLSRTTSWHWLFKLGLNSDLARCILFFSPESGKDSRCVKVLRGQSFTLTGCRALMQVYISRTQSSQETRRQMRTDGCSFVLTACTGLRFGASCFVFQLFRSQSTVRYKCQDLFQA